MADLTLLCAGKSREFLVLLSALNSSVYGFPLDVAAGNLSFISGGFFLFYLLLLYWGLVLVAY